MNSKSAIEFLLQPTGIHINGDDSSDIFVKDDRFYKSVLSTGSLGLGESYMEGWWNCSALDDLLTKLINSGLEERVKHNLPFLWLSLTSNLFNRQTIQKAGKVAAIHYNLGNELFEHMLDRYMMYSCAYWDNAATLDEAQERKLDLICRKLHLSPGMTVLDIGCGWGGFAQYASDKYKVKVIGITISEEQATLARERCKELPVEIRLQDYREVNGSFDRIVSIGMLEHVGFKNYPLFMTVVHRNLKKDGIFLLHCIGGNEEKNFTDPWINRYIFPNSMMPYTGQIVKATEKSFVLQDWHNFGLYYDLTLMEWLKNFKSSWPFLRSKYGTRFYRMWEYYLCVCAASFRTGRNNLWQIVLTKPTFPTIYKSVR